MTQGVVQDRHNFHERTQREHALAGRGSRGGVCWQGGGREAVYAGREGVEWRRTLAVRGSRGDLHWQGGGRGAAYAGSDGVEGRHPLF